MKVAYPLRYYPTLTETFVYREIRELQARGVEVCIVALGSRPDGELADELPDAEVIRPPHGLRTVATMGAAVRMSASKFGRSSTIFAWARSHLRPKDVARAAWVGEALRGRSVDRIHGHFAGEAAEWARVAASIAGVPYGLTVHAVDLFKPRPSLPDLLGDARPLLTVAEHHRRWIAERYGLDAVVVRCGVDATIAADPAAAGELRVIAVGRNVPKKGLDLLVNAMREVRGNLRLVADAPELAGEGVALGPLAPSAVREALARAHLFALPCRIAPDGDRDGIPMALIEAMAAGLPVVTTAVSGIPELVDDAVGWVVPSEDHPALVAALREAAASPRERARRGQNGRERVQRRGFTLAAQVDGLMAAWQLA